MAENIKSMFDKFSFISKWSLDSGLSDASFGELKYDYQNGCILKITPSFLNENQYFNSDVKKYEKIYGLSENGTFILGTGYSLGLNGNIPELITESIKINRFSLSNFNFIEEFSPNKLYINFTGIENWLPKPNIAVPVKNNTIGIILDPIGVKLGNVKYKDNNYSLTIEYAANKEILNPNANKVALNYQSFLSLFYGKKFNDEQAIEISESLLNFFELIAFPANLKIIQLSNGNKQRYLFVRQNHKVYLNEDSFPEKALLRYNDVKDSLGLLVTNWFNKKDTLNRLVKYYLATIHFDTIVENDLINLTQGIESYYYNLKRVSLKDKIVKFIGELPDIYTEILMDHFTDVDKWIEKIKNTRVYITHGTKKDKAIHDPQKLTVSVMVLSFLVRVFILQQIGVGIENERLERKLEGIFDMNVIQL